MASGRAIPGVRPWRTRRLLPCRMVLALLAACWSGRHVVTTSLETELGRRSQESVVAAGGVLAQVVPEGDLRFENFVRHRTTTFKSVRMDTWQEREADLVIGARRRLASSVTREEIVEQHDTDVTTGPYTGPLTVTAVAGDTPWEHSGVIAVVSGTPKALDRMPFLPVDVTGGTLRLETPGGPLAGLPALGIYDGLVHLALDQPPSAGRFVDDWSAWYQPRLTQVRLVGINLPSLRTDAALPIRGLDVAAPEPFVHATLNGASLGCSTLLGENLREGYYRFAESDSVIAAIRGIDDFALVVYDEDLSASGVDELKGWHRRGSPATGALGWAIVESGPVDRPEEPHWLGTCEQKGEMPQPSGADHALPLATPGEFASAYAAARVAIETCAERYPTTPFGTSAPTRAEVAKHLILRLGTTAIGRSDEILAGALRAVVDTHVQGPFPDGDGALFEDCVVRAL